MSKAKKAMAPKRTLTKEEKVMLIANAPEVLNAVKCCMPFT